MKPTLFVLATLAIYFPVPASVSQAVAQQSSQAVVASRIPDENTLARLVWSTLVALDNANRTGNYEVLRGLGTAGFQERNSVASLYQSFADLRLNRVDVGRVILSSPTYYRTPEILPDGSLRLRGGFDFRPQSIRFDLIYANVGGGWQLNAISVVETRFDAPR